MTDKIMEARRAGFESAISDILVAEGYKRDSVPSIIARGSNGEYQTIRVNGAWIGFNAALDSVCVDLNVTALDFEGEDFLMKCDVIEAIDAAGVRTK